MNNSTNLDYTKQTYEDPDVVAGYVQTNAINPKIHDILSEFSKLISGKKVLDLGCGPGHDSYKFAELGYDITGLDYSSEMIKQAKVLKNSKKRPKFVVGDILNLRNLFEPNTFDAVWSSAALLHIEEEQMPKVLQDIKDILRNEDMIYLSVRSGNQGPIVVNETRCGKVWSRKFILWHKETFLQQLRGTGFSIDKTWEVESRPLNNTPTTWLHFFAHIEK